MNRQKLAPLTASEPTVHIVDDDDSFREALEALFESVSIPAAAYADTASFLRTSGDLAHGCILLDVRLPGINGLDFQKELEGKGVRLPIIFMSGYGDVAMTVKAMKAGALDFLAKPFKDQDLLDAVHSAFQLSLLRRHQSELVATIQRRFANLTARERDVMFEVVKGLMNKQIAFNLGISEVTTKIHRGTMMRKMEARSVAELVKYSEMLTVSYTHTEV